MKLEYQLTPTDHRQYLWWLWRSPLMLVCQIIIMLGLFVSFGSAIYRVSPDIFPTFATLFVLFCLILFLLSYILTAWFQIISMKRHGLFHHTRLLINDQGVTRLYGPDQRRGDQYPWVSFRRYHETKDLFLLQFQPKTIVVPKRELSQEKQEEFRTTLQNYEARVYGQ